MYSKLPIPLLLLFILSTASCNKEKLLVEKSELPTNSDEANTYRAWDYVRFVDEPKYEFCGVSITDAVFPSEEVGYIIGKICDHEDKSLVCKTTDGGKSWKVVDRHSKGAGTIGMKGLFFNSEEGVYYGIGNGDTYCRKTNNGASTWSEINVDLDMGYEDKLSCKIDEQNGILGEYITKDMGNSWTKISTLFDSISMVDVHFLDKSFGVFISRTSIYATSDLGDSWELIDSDSASNSTAVQILDETTIFLTGVNHTMLVKKRGNKWYSDYSGFVPSAITDVLFVSKNVGFVCTKVEEFNKGEIYKTIDGGRNWNLVFESDRMEFSELVQIDNSSIIAAGSGEYAVITTTLGE